MADEAQANLENYRLQLQQVEESLELDKTNAELLKLKGDLEEVIKLTLELIGDADDETDVISKWKIGDECLAKWSQDNQYYPSKIDDIYEDGTCQVSFLSYRTQTEFCQMSSLKELTEESRISNHASHVKKRKNDSRNKAIEHKRKKVQKKAERLELITKQCEQEKNVWQQFSKKMVKQGRFKKSIFASPESVEGKVGVGTCGTAGRPMTKFNPNRFNHLKK